MNSKLLAIIVVIVLLVLAIFLFLNPHKESETFSEAEIFYTHNGTEFWLLEDHYLPIVALRISIARAGASYDDKEKLGLANMVAALLDEGAGDYDAQAFQAELEAIASDVSFDVDNDYFYISLTTLSEHLPRAMELLKLALNEPKFSQDAIERVRNQLLVSISKQKEKPDYLAGEKLREEFFNTHPYAHPAQGNEETISSITRNDLMQFVENHFIRSEMKLSVVGAVSAADIASAFDDVLAGLREEIAWAESDIPLIDSNHLGEAFHVNIDVPQTVIAFALPAPLRHEDSFYPAYVLNYILGGGGFESRLMKKIREKEGLVYSVYSSYTTNNKAAFISGSAATESQKAHKTINEIKQQFAELHDKGVTEEELNDAKSYLIHSFPLRMTRNSYLASFLDTMQREELGTDFLQRRNQLVEAVTLAQVNQVAKKWLNPDQLMIVSAGPDGVHEKE